ncbi:hypothetical protein CXK86_20090 [Paenibacillus sp. BGI2013]|uniref:hypothetical protein n=1 Tax=Paenibacillus sp. BGI2013 TaxID=2058902 RepID=UPI000C6EF98C|nr:hypothetical protein [Paenibacillus sp. BGI2013]PKQ89354.1 hypothetical protein CXK86_20090 [Paenibacillus sp. BGI2013]
MRGKVVALIGSPGAGRRTLQRSLTHPTTGIASLVKIPSFTTRRMRMGESEGNPFYFISPERFEREIKEGRLFAEGILKHGERVAAPIHRYEEELSRGWFPVIDLDLEGAKKFKEQFPDRVIVIYVRVTDSSTLWRRVRATEDIISNQYLLLEQQDQYMEAYADFTMNNPDGELEIEMAMGEVRSYVLDIVNEHSKAGFISEQG